MNLGPSGATNPNHWTDRELLNSCTEMGEWNNCLGTEFPECMGYNCVAEWELRLTATGEHHDKVSWHISLGQEMFKIQSTISTEHVSCLHCHEVKIASQDTVKSGPICIYIPIILLPQLRL